MKTGDAPVEQVPRLASGPIDAGAHHGSGIVLDDRQPAPQLIGDPRPAHLGESLELRHIGDGHQPGHDGHIDAHAVGATNEGVIVLVVEEKLQISFMA